MPGKDKGTVGNTANGKVVDSSESLPRKLTQDDFPNAKYGRNRIQTLEPEYEVLLKQFWTYYLKYLGFDVDIPDSDVVDKKSYVVSASVQRKFPNEKVTEAPKSGSFWGGHAAAVPIDDDISKLTERAGKLKLSANYVNVTYPETYFYNYLVHFDSVSVLSDSYKDRGDEVDRINLIVEELKSVAGLEKHPSIAVKPNLKLHHSFNICDPKVTHNTFLVSGRNDPIDNYFLKLLRARKGNMDKTLDLFAGDVNWRSEIKLTDLVLGGDAQYHLTGTGDGIIRNLNCEKCWIKGTDREGNLLFLFKANRHFTNEAPQDEMRRWTLLKIEWTRLLLRETLTGKDTVSILFDLSGFGLKNADYSTMKFIAEFFEAHQPECLAHVLIYKAPWIFLAFWNIVKGWLDPDVAAKISFIKNEQELLKFVDKKDVPSCMGGDNTYNGEYIFPDENIDTAPPMQKDDRYFELIKERHLLQLRLYERTKRWIEATDPEVSSLYWQDKVDTNIQLAQNYITLDPYIRKRGMYDRNGFLKLQL